MTVEVRRVGYADRLFAPLLAEGEAAEGAFLSRLRDQWRSGELRFEREGEVLLGAFDRGLLVGVADISHDPYAPEPGLGRVRHVYVLRAWRGQGVARLLLERLIAHASGSFTALRLSAVGRPAAIRLYERLGFVACDGDGQTHRLSL